MGAAVNTSRRVYGASVGITKGRLSGRRMRRPYGLVMILSTALLSFSLTVAQTPLTPMPQALPDSLRASNRADSASVAKGPVSRADTTIIVKHNFNHRQQIITGSIIMACAAAMVVVMNNYNPQTLQQ